MNLYRLTKSKYASDLSGKGAELTGGRWNSKGTAVLYTSESRALCTVELAVHTALGNIPNDYVLVTIVIPDDLPIKQIFIDQLPSNWKTFPHINSTQTIGDQFIEEGKYPLLKVPSAVVTGDHNFLINPIHPDSKKIQIINIELFEFDKRMFYKEL